MGSDEGWETPGGASSSKSWNLQWKRTFQTGHSVIAAHTQEDT